jgi:hypothetical protein
MLGDSIVISERCRQWRLVPSGVSRYQTAARLSVVGAKKVVTIATSLPRHGGVALEESNEGWG